MRSFLLKALISILALTVAQVAFAETKVFVMPDGSKVSVEVPKGMTYTREEAVRSWEAMNRLERERRAAGEATKAGPASRDSGAYPEAKPQRTKVPQERPVRVQPTSNPAFRPTAGGQL